MAAEQVSRASEAAASRQGAALDAAKRDAADAHAQAVQHKGSLEALQRQLASQVAEAERHAKVLVLILQLPKQESTVMPGV